MQKFKPQTILPLLLLTASPLLSQQQNQPRSDLEWENNLGCSKNCEICNQTLDICQQCAPAFYFDPSTSQCISGSIANCKIYSSANECKECNSGFRPQSNTCQACQVANCKTCNLNIATCELCLNTHTKTSATANDCSLICNAQNCDLCIPGSQTQCQICKTGYRLNSAGRCEKCNIANCANCTSSVNNCDVLSQFNSNGTLNKSCMSAFYWGEGRCQSCETGCLYCNRSGICLSCDTSKGFYMFRDMKCKFCTRLRFVLGFVISFLVVSGLIG